jgi:hypothetical protein
VNNIKCNKNILRYKEFDIRIIINIKNNLFFTRKTELTLEKRAFRNLNPLYQCVRMFYMLSYLYLFSLSTAIEWRVWAVSETVSFCNTSEPTESDKQCSSDKIISLNKTFQS